MKKQTLQSNIAMNDPMTLDCVRPAQSSIIRIIHRNVGLKFLLFYLSKCSFLIIDIYVYFTYTVSKKNRTPITF